ncbi:MAG TPA: hypothetical protein VJS64_04990, partial [Pyrinomonadaceae bacterium]|nr:hypothetical protein [Pyrinomonadaceae bacterium]
MKIDDPRTGLITLVFILVLSSATYKFAQDPNTSDQLRGDNNAARLRAACYSQEKKIEGIGADRPADSLPRSGSGDVLYQKSELTIATMFLVLLMLVTEVGFRVGRRSLSGLNEFSKSQLGAISAGIIGLLALLLGFTFAMALSRFDLRKQLVMEESKAIQTAYLRSRLLPEPDKREIAGLLRRYIVARVDFHRAGIDRDRLREVNCRTEQLQSELWSHTLSVVRKDDREVTTGLF